jgi:uncharacterized protein YndB with AHSA1/START domain
MVVVSRSIHIKAPLERVFALLCDPAARSRLNPLANPIRAEVESHGPLGRGTVCHFRLQIGNRIVDYRTRITEFEPNWRIVSVSDSAIPFETRLEVYRENGGTRLTHTERFEPTDEMLAQVEPNGTLKRAVSLAYRLTRFLGAEEADRLRVRQEEMLGRRLEGNLEHWLTAIKQHLEGSGPTR